MNHEDTVMDTQAGSPGRLSNNYSFWLILTGTTISSFGDTFNTVAITLWVLMTTKSPAAMSVVLAVRMMVSVALGTVAGTVVDRVDRRKLMVMFDFIQSMIVGMLIYLILSKAPFWELLVLLALLSAASQFRDPAFSASLIHIVGEQGLPRASSALQVAIMLSRVLGPVLGGSIVSWFGISAALIGDAISFAVSALFVLAAKPFPNPHIETAKKSKFLKDLVNGVVFVSKNAIASYITIFAFCLNFFSYGATLLIPTIAVLTWKTTPTELGTIQGAFPLGFAAGSGVLMALGHHIRKRWAWMGLATILAGLLMGSVSLVHKPMLALPFIFLTGFAFAFVSILITVAIRTLVAPDLQGRVLGTLDSVGNLATPLAMVLAGLWSDKSGAPVVLMVVGLGTMAIGALSICVRRMRTFD
ncbi:Predicted arabinose efflux permease, MFS family [Alicyclobacillus vulcanalis]|uniref:Predicted arabinose efflux permease, MFS family n=3 Tax=Alicyclobacillus TaxID=29330 RepID=A0A1N7PNF2_9BACL|nr:Predicted arabinose efflux permease, MFS family [Alicyclobacillus vulcanalis]